jgi:hypothetical protein
LKGGFRALARDPLAIYANLYRAKVVRQLGNLQRVDVVPTDRRLPPMANIPLKVGVPGVEVKILPGHFVLVGWENGQPDKPYATIWAPGTSGTTPVKTTVNASALELGGPAVEAVIHGTTYVLAEKAWVTSQQALGAALAALAAALAPVVAIGGPAQAAAGAVAAVAALATSQTTSFLAGQYLSPVVTTQ